MFHIPDVLRLRTVLTVLLAAIIALPGGAPALTAQQSAPPKLAVILVVDQFRASYFEQYGDNFTAGLRRLMRDGAWFTNARYPFLNTVTCAGHSTISTGNHPYRHGMILNAWLDRSTGRAPYCTDDPDVKDISYGGLDPVEGNSPRRLLTPSLGEQILGRGGRSVILSLKPRSSVPLAGRKSTAVVWFDDRGGWATSTAYTDAPVPFLQQFIDANPISADYDKVWERTLPASAYQFEDDAEGEGRPAGWTRVFPHPLGTEGGKPDATFYSRWQRSPYSDDYLGRMAAAAVDALKLGHGERTDFLAVSFSALDFIGHAYGPRSHEVQDLLVRLDRTIGQLLDHLDKHVGRDNYVVGFSSDHGVAEVPEQTGTGGRQTGRQVMDAVNAALEPTLGQGPHVAVSAYTDIYLGPSARERVRRDRRLRTAALDALRGLPGVEAAFHGDELASGRARSSPDPVQRAAALSYHPERSGDLIIAPKKNWLLSTAVTTHGTHHDYDQDVPVMLYGSTVRAGKYDAEATPADLAPTLAAITEVRIQKTDGRVLDEALAVPAGSK